MAQCWLHVMEKRRMVLRISLCLCSLPLYVLHSNTCHLSTPTPQQQKFFLYGPNGIHRIWIWYYQRYTYWFPNWFFEMKVNVVFSPAYNSQCWWSKHLWSVSPRSIAHPIYGSLAIHLHYLGPRRLELPRLCVVQRLVLARGSGKEGNGWTSESLFAPWSNPLTDHRTNPS